MPKNQMTRILEDPLKHESMTYGYGGVLAGLFARILWDMRITVPRWLSLMNDFVNDASNSNQTQNQKDRTSMRGNLHKEFSRAQMTWKVFLKGLRFLQVVKFQIIIVALHTNGKTTEHKSKVINLGDRMNLQDFLRSVDTPDEADEAEEIDEQSQRARAAEVDQLGPQTSKPVVSEDVSAQVAGQWVEQQNNAVKAGQKDPFDGAS